MWIHFELSDSSWSNISTAAVVAWSYFVNKSPVMHAIRWSRCLIIRLKSILAYLLLGILLRATVRQRADHRLQTTFQRTIDWSQRYCFRGQNGNCHNPIVMKIRIQTIGLREIDIIRWVIAKFYVEWRSVISILNGVLMYRQLHCCRISIHKNLVVSFMIRSALFIFYFEPFVTSRAYSYRDIVSRFETSFYFFTHAQQRITQKRPSRSCLGLRADLSLPAVL
jgi:hypothetical protein